ncbi:Bll6545 protein [Alloactinosynnema sp. L-07]|nr:Bll6545 protein [Alloactinosynnema sp. L-07]
MARRRDRRALDLTQAALIRLLAENERLRRENERLRRDPVTGVLLRLAWTDAAKEALPTLRDPVLLLLDVNNLKPVNDILGHAAGDDLLREITRRLHVLTGMSALIGRLGGDEFAVLLDLPDGNWRHYLEVVAGACAVDVGDLRCGAAFGAVRPVDVVARDPAAEAAVRHRVDRLMHAADLAMYRAKRRCRDERPTTSIAFYGPEDPAVPERLEPVIARVRDHGAPLGHASPSTSAAREP